jgi:RimJ/RimL family protein N-acetyltransferase
MTVAATALQPPNRGRQAPEGVVLATRRLRVRPMIRDDVERIYEVNRHLNPEYLSAPALDAAGLEELRAAFEGEWLATGMGYLMACRIEDDEPLGHVRLKLIPNCASGRTAELTYAIAATHQNQGYATEAVAAVLRFAFEDARLDYVVACVEPENLASCRVVEKNGMVTVAKGRVYGRMMRRYLLPQTMWIAQRRAEARERARLAT